MGTFFRSWNLLKLEKIIQWWVLNVSLIITGFSNSRIFAVIFFKGKSEIGFPGAGVRPPIGILTVETFHMGLKKKKKWYLLDPVLELESLVLSKSDWKIGFWVANGTRIGGRMMMMCFFLYFFCYANLKWVTIPYAGITQYLSITIISILL